MDHGEILALDTPRGLIAGLDLRPVISGSTARPLPLARIEALAGAGGPLQITLYYDQTNLSQSDATVSLVSQVVQGVNEQLIERQRGCPRSIASQRTVAQNGRAWHDGSNYARQAGSYVMNPSTDQPIASAEQPIEQLVDRFERNEISRSRFVALLAAMGVSGAGIEMVSSTSEAKAARLEAQVTRLPAKTNTDKQSGKHHTNKKLHQIHVKRQGQATVGGPVSASSLDPQRAQILQAILDDYADDAVVDDPMFEAPIAGKNAIAERKLAEITSIGNAAIDVTHRFAHGDQVVAEWVLRGTHQGDFLGFAATGRHIEVRGMTIVTRANGKITRESLYYDVAGVQRQLS
jgi:steroid delta-isomerase-like uncharacterized protein